MIVNETGLGDDRMNVLWVCLISVNGMCLFGFSASEHYFVGGGISMHAQRRIKV